MTLTETMRVPHTNLLICIPAYNEGENIGAVIDSILFLQNIGSFDLLVVDDGSGDNTRRICESKGIMVITHIYNMGYGAALKTAYKYATDHDYNYVIQIDADGQHDILNIEKLYQKLTESDNETDIVIGSRFLQNSVSFHTPFYKKFVIHIFRLFIRITTKQKITDPTSGLQGLNRRAFEFYAMFERFDIDYPDANMIIQMIMNEFSVKEMPAIMHPRTKGESMHSGFYKPLKYIVKMTLSVLIVFIREMFSNKNKR